MGRRMRLLFLTLLILFTFSSTFAQSLPTGSWIELGLDFSFNPAVGISIGRVDYDKPIGKINYVGLYWLGFDGVIGKGKYYDVISFEQFPENVKKQGNSFNHFGVRLGMSTEREFLPYAILGIKAVSVVQNRYDRFKILGESGKYYISEFKPKKTEMDIGIGFRITPQGNNPNKFILGIEASRQRGLSFILNYSAPWS